MTLVEASEDAGSSSDGEDECSTSSSDSETDDMPHIVQPHQLGNVLTSLQRETSRSENVDNASCDGITYDDYI